MKKNDLSVNLATVGALAALSFVMFFIAKSNEAKENKDVAKIHKYQQTQVSFSQEKQIIGKELLKAKIKSPQKNYLELLPQIKTQLATEQSKEKADKFDLVFKELEALLKAMPEKESLLLLGYVSAQNDHDIIDYTNPKKVNFTACEYLNLGEKELKKEMRKAALQRALEQKVKN